MRPVSPELDLGGFLADEDTIEPVDSEGADPAGDAARTMTYARYVRDDGIRVICSRWRLSGEEKDAIVLGGADLYLFEVGPMRELFLHVGAPSPEFLHG